MRKIAKRTEDRVAANMPLTEAQAYELETHRRTQELSTNKSKSIDFIKRSLTKLFK